MLWLAVITTSSAAMEETSVRKFVWCSHLKIVHSFLAVVHLQNRVCDPIVSTVTSSSALLPQLKCFSEASCSCVFCSAVMDLGFPGNFSVDVYWPIF